MFLGNQALSFFLRIPSLGTGECGGAVRIADKAESLAGALRGPLQPGHPATPGAPWV